MIQETNEVRIQHLVLQFFNKDEVRAALWMDTSNVLLGDVSPNYMISIGRAEKLLKFIETGLAENPTYTIK